MCMRLFSISIKLSSTVSPTHSPAKLCVSVYPLYYIDQYTSYIYIYLIISIVDEWKSKRARREDADTIWLILTYISSLEWALIDLSSDINAFIWMAVRIVTLAAVEMFYLILDSVCVLLLPFLLIFLAFSFFIFSFSSNLISFIEHLAYLASSFLHFNQIQFVTLFSSGAIFC